MTERVQQVHRVAQELFEKAPDWVTFFREVLGVNGAIRQQFRTPDEMSQFEQTDSYTQIQHMLAKLRAKNGDQVENNKEPTRVITVRLPQSLHESLRAEAHDRHTSMNKLCISKLLQVIGEEMIPNERVGGGSPSPSSGSSIGSTVNHGTTHSSSLGLRPHQPTSVGVNSPYGQQLQPTSQGLPPFKPSQPRF